MPKNSEWNAVVCKLEDRITQLEVENKKLKDDLRHIAEGLSPARDELQSAFYVLTGIMHTHSKPTPDSREVEK